ncbi:MAG: hypothetical protein KDD56_06270, partial [Bdellovibrionales bacterium]|nr:hypothetical protein [Bdellovibrionales bacterium]
MKRFFGLQGCSKAWKIDELARESEKLLIICADSKIQENLFEDLKFFAADKQIISFKGWESLPYEQLSPPIDISADRISSIFKLNENSWDIIITSVESLIQKVLPYKLLEPISFSINEQQLISRESIIKKLNIGGYRRVSLVEEVGDYAVRGSVIDFFPSDVKSPVRIEFFDNEIERLRFFNPETQRTISSLDSLRILPV